MQLFSINFIETNLSVMAPILQYFIYQNTLKVGQHLTRILLWKDQLMFTCLFKGETSQ
jgi:hypothetical protein